MYFVYLLLCDNGSIYTGITTDVDRRLQEHRSGKGAKYTRAIKPVRIVHTESFNNRSQAQEREAEIKSWTRARKLTLIA
jgi:putative endonuclease